MRRREFIGIAGGAVAWPLAAHAQQSERPRLIGILIPFDADDPQVKARLSAFSQGLQELGWIENRNIRFDYRFTGQDAEGIRTGTEELIAHGPDLIVAWSNTTVAIVQKATQTIPIVFVGASDPVESGFVTDLSRPSGNITGFQNFEAEIGGKWLERIRVTTPRVHLASYELCCGKPIAVRLLSARCHKAAIVAHRLEQKQRARPGRFESPPAARTLPTALPLHFPLMI
jgi:putative tryptophan/tyrosine transport system substrate-binding protein